MISGARSTNDLDRLGESVPAYRPAPDYETAVLSKFQGSNRITQGGRTVIFVFGFEILLHIFAFQARIKDALIIANSVQHVF
jgi:hypothetical protein